MSGTTSATPQQTGALADVFHATNLTNSGEYATVTLDGLGRIRSCCAAAEGLFGASQVRLRGAAISEFIADIFLGGNSPSYGARHLVHLCAENGWRKVEAIDIGGRRIAVDINLSRTQTTGQEFFDLTLRRSQATACR